MSLRTSYFVCAKCDCDGLVPLEAAHLPLQTTASSVSCCYALCVQFQKDIEVEAELVACQRSKACQPKDLYGIFLQKVTCSLSKCMQCTRYMINLRDD